MKRIICLVLCALMAASVCACGNESTATPTQAAPETEVQEQTEAAEEATAADGTISLKSFIGNFDTSPTVEEQVIYESKDITVTLNSLDYAAVSGPGLKLTIENRYDREIIAQSPYAVVNGYMVSPEMNIKAQSSKTASGTLTIPYFNLAISNITSLQKIEFALRIVESNNYEPISETGLIAVETSASKDETTSCDESGDTAYDDNDIKIILKGINTDRAYSDGAELMVYMYNGTDRNIAVRTDNVIVNGYDMTSAMNRTILPEKRAVDVVTFYTLDMEEYGIDEIDSVDVSFEIKDADNWETIDSTDLISVKLPEKPTEAETSEETKEK